MPLDTGPVGRRDARPPFALAIDVGTSSTRVVAFDAAGRAIAATTTRDEHALATDALGAATLDADRIADGVVRCIDRTLTKLGRRQSAIGAVGMSVFWHGLLGIDARGRPVTPLYTWADLRARDAARTLAREIDADAFHGRTGCYLHSTYPAVKLRWLRDAQPGLMRRVARWVSFAEYLALRVHGEAAASHGISSATGLYDQARRAWDPAILEVAGIDERRLSAISDEPQVGLRRAFADRWPALVRLPWIPGSGDGALANVGSGCATRDRAAISLGTSGAVRACYRAERADAPKGLWAYRLDERYVVVGGAVNNGWNVMQWTTRAWGTAPPRGTPHGLTVLPTLAGERTPWWDDAASGAIVGLRLATDAAQVAGAFTEAVMLRLAAATQALLEARPDVDRLIASGGVFGWRPQLAQVIADTLGRPVALSAELEASARGAAIVALARIGALRSIEVAPTTTKTFRPRARLRDRYRDLLERQARLHAALREARL